MKLKNSIFSFIKTIIFASVIIIAGYTILAKASRYIIRYDNKITPVAIEKMIHTYSILKPTVT